MAEVIAQNEAKAKILHDFVAETYVPQLRQHLAQTHDYLDLELKDFQRLEDNGENLLQNLFDRKNNWSKNVKQMTEKIQKESDLQKKAETYKRAKKDELVSKQKTIDSVSSSMKESCSKIKADLLAKLTPLPAELNEVFKKLFYILYDEDESKFEWADFKQKGLLSDKGEDFQTRLANFPLR